MPGFAILASLAAIVLGLVAASRAASAAADIRELQSRLREMERQLRNALSRLGRLDPHTMLDEPVRETHETEPAEVPEAEDRSAEIADAVARLAEEVEVTRVERRVVEQHDEEPVRAAAVPPPLPRQQRVIEPAIIEPVAPRVREWIKKLGPNDPNMGWEMALGTYWLPRIGVIALAAAVVFALSLAFQHWGPPIRVGLGYAVSAALLGLGWRLDKKYPNYARVLSAAGLALTYFVTYATYFVPFAKILESPYISLAGQAGIVGIWAAAAQRRKSQILAGITLGLGHFTIALTTYSVASPGPYSIAGIVFLSLGGAYFLARNGWFVVAALGLIASYANHLYLMSQLDSTGTPFEFATGLGILSTYFLVYTGAELLAPDAMRRERIPFWFRNAFAVVNTLAFLALGTLLMDGYDFAEDQQYLFRYGLAVALLVVAVVYLRVRQGDPLHNTYFVKGISAATWGLATQFDAHTLSAGLAIETALLLFAARRGGLLVTRMMAYGVGLLAVSQSLITLIDLPALAYNDPGFPKLAIETAIVLVAFQFAAWLYRYTDWSTRSPARSIFDAETNGMLWRLDLFAAAPEGYTLRKPLNGMLYPYAFALAGALLGALYAIRLTAGDDGPLVLAILSFGFALISVPLRMRPFGLAALVMFGFAIAADLGELWDTPLAKGVPMIALLVLVAFATESRYLGEREGLALFRKRPMPYILYALVTALVAFHLETAIESVTNTLIALGIAVVAAAVATIPLHHRALAWCATGLLLWTQFHWAVSWTAESTAAYLTLAWALIALGVAAERYFAAIAVRVAGPVALAASAVLFAVYLLFECAPGWAPVWGAVGACALLAFAGATRGRTAAVLGLMGLVAASLYQVNTALIDDPETLPMVLGFVAPALGWIAVERAGSVLVGRFGLSQDFRTAFLAGPAIATALLALMLFKLPLATTYYLTLSWCGLGIALFVLAVTFRERTYRFCGLAVLGLATLRAAFIDTRELEALPRVFALGGLGLVLLALGYAYVRVFARAQKSATTTE